MWRQVHLASGIAVSILASMGTALAGSFSETYFFGDGLTDAGFYRPLLPTSVQPVTGQFTTNPADVWVQIIADEMGTSADPNGNGQTGTNYANGGARVIVDRVLALGPAPSMNTGVNTYLTEHGGVADPGALYTVWGGMNDIALVLDGFAPPTDIDDAAVGEVAIVQALANAGARYILVPTVYDLGTAPTYRAAGPATQANATALTQNFNTQLFDGLAAANLPVIPLNTFALLQEVVADPVRYGFSNVTGTACMPQITANSLTCNPTSLVAQDAPYTHLFADSVHLSAGGHQLLAQYTLSVLDAPAQMGQIADSAVTGGRARFQSLTEHLGQPSEQGNFWWGQGLAGLADGGGNVDVMAGVKHVQGNVTLGMHAGFGRQNHEETRDEINFVMPTFLRTPPRIRVEDVNYQIAGNGTEHDATEASIGVFVGWRGTSLWVNSLVNVSLADYDITRTVALGAATRRHHGETHGHSASLGFTAGYDVEMDKLTITPLASLLLQHVSLDGFAEDNPDLSTSMRFLDINRRSAIGSLGAEFAYELTDLTEVFARATWDHEFAGVGSNRAQLQSISGSLPFALPGSERPSDTMTLHTGFRSWHEAFNVTGGLISSLAMGGDTNLTGYLTLSRSF